MIYRCKYSKLNDMAYIAHLDLLRIFIRALRRASISVNYSQGYSPHAKISFSPALGLGIESYAEVIDIDTSEEIPPEEMIARLNKALPEGIEILSCEIAEKLPAISTTMTHSKYEFVLEEDFMQRMEVEKALEAMRAAEEIIIMKKNKKKKKEVELDVRGRIFDCTLRNQSIYGTIQNSIDGALKPTEFLDILNQYLDQPIETERIIKVESYYIDGERRSIV